MKISLLKSIILKQKVNRKKYFSTSKGAVKKIIRKITNLELNFLRKKTKLGSLDPSHQSASGNVNFQHFCLVQVVKVSFPFQVNSNYKYQYRSKNLK